MIVNPGIRRFIGSAIQRLFNSASVSLPLTHTAVPARGSIVPSFTRATTSTWPNNDGYMVTGVAGEIGFVGARRVRNWIQAPTENWASAGWVKSGISVSGNRLTATGANGVIYDNAALGMGTGRTAVGSVTLSRVTGTGNIDVSTNGGTTWTTVSVTGARVSVSLTGNINGQFAIRIVTSGDSVDATYPQLENVTAQTTQTAGEYVSVGVESAPYYHGSFVDGVKCFATDINGAAIPSTTLLGYLAEGARTNLCLQSQTFDSWTDSGAAVTANSTIAPDGTTTADTITRVAGQGDARYVTLTLASNAVHAVSLWIKKGTSPSSLIALYDATAVAYKLRVDVTWSGTTPSLAFTNGSLIRSEEWANGLWRIELLTEAVVAANTNRLYIYPGRAGSANGETVIAWGAQVELGSFASSYIPTTTIAVARNADVLTYSSAGNILGTVGAAYAEVFRSAPIDSSSHSILCNATVNRSLMVMRSTTALLGYYDGTNDISSNAPAITSGATNKVAISYFGSAAQTAVRGTASSSAAFDGNFNVDSSIEIGNNGSGTGAEFYGNIRNVRIWQRALSSSELQAITS